MQAASLFNLMKQKLSQKKCFSHLSYSSAMW